MEVMLGEHRARVMDIKAHPKGVGSDLFRKEDTLSVWLELEPPVDALLSFGIELPVKDYSREEFRADVSRLGEISLARSLRSMAEERAAREVRKEATARVDQAAKKLREKFGI